MASVEDAAERINQIEVEAERLFHRLEPADSPSVDEDVLSLTVANNKLKYRIEHLKRSIADEERKQLTSMTNVQGVVNALFKTAVRRAYPSLPVQESIVQALSDAKFGDYKCAVSMSLSQALKSSGVNTPPRTLADNIMKSLPQQSKDTIDKCEVAGPGFINITLKTSFVSRLVSDLLVHGVRPPPIQRKMRVVIDFSSPNIAKEMHVGHLRSTIIGETISRLLEFFGHDVLRLNHVGDWGTQFGMLIAHMKDIFPDYLVKAPPISDLQKFYQDSKKRFDKDEQFKRRSYDEVVKLQSGDRDVITAWQLICDESRKEMAQVYKRLDATIIERGESFYHSMMPKVVEDLEKKGFIKADDGCKLLYSPDHTVPLMMVKSDGGFTYDTSDMAALKHRVEEEKGDWLIYVVDSGQGLHFETVFSASKMVGYLPDKVRVNHVGFGVVLGEDRKKLKTRSGDSVKLKELLDEGLERALARLKEKGRHEVLSEEELKAAQCSVAYGCIKYADLSHTRTNDYVFSFDKMLDDKGNTAVYLLYAYTRLRSIIRLSGVTPQQLDTAAKTEFICLNHEKELKIAKCLIRFPEVLHRVADDLYPHVLCDYLYELCCTMTEFYDACYCVEKDRVTGEIVKVNMSRILICEATRLVLHKAFEILGIEPVERM